MKNLVKIGLVLLVSGAFSSCGIPMATVRSVQAAAKTAASAAGY
ncbi:hypothetical protein ACFSSA_09850 [Luteolibacter algae]|uniref:Uncharacterized protein n=1 Tax=Luteolibacter algae TaxID=454151 RepID=A0ABW5D9D4_9BACT